MKLPDYINVYVGSRRYRGGDECPDELVAQKLIDDAKKKAAESGATVKHKGIIEMMTKSPELRNIMHEARKKAGHYFDGEKKPIKKKETK